MSTGQRGFDEAIVVAHEMVQKNGERPRLRDTSLTDEEFEEIQRTHFGRKHEPAARDRAEKTLDDCLEAITAFRTISGLNPVVLATADDCAAFQREALGRPKN